MYSYRAYTGAGHYVLMFTVNYKLFNQCIIDTIECNILVEYDFDESLVSKFCFENFGKFIIALDQCLVNLSFYHFS